MLLSGRLPPGVICFNTNTLVSKSYKSTETHQRGHCSQQSGKGEVFEPDVYGWLQYGYKGNGSRSWRQTKPNLSPGECRQFPNPGKVSPPSSHRCTTPVQPACLTMARLGPREVFIAAGPPWAWSCVHLRYHGSVMSRVTAKNRASETER